MITGAHLCSKCRKETPSIPPGSPADRAITGGLCQECFQHVAESGMPLADFLDGLEAPVLLVDSDVVVKATNQVMRTMLGKDISQVQGYRGGDVFVCAYARLPEGCGRTVHCSGCAIRRSVMETFTTGKSLRNVPAHLDRQIDNHFQQLGLRISTEKAWNLVLLRIDYIGPSREVH